MLLKSLSQIHYVSIIFPSFFNAYCLISEMLHMLEKVRLGLESPKSLIRAESTRRSYNLRLSELRDIEMVQSGGINTLDIDPSEGRYLLSGCADGTIYIHSLQSAPNSTSPVICEINRQNTHAHKYSIECVQWYPFDSGMFVTTGMDKRMKIWDTNLMKPVEEFLFESRVFRHDISKDCLVAVVSSSKQVQLVDLRSGAFTHELRGHSDAVLACKWSVHQDSLLATGSSDNRAIIWDIRSSKNFLLSLDQTNRQQQHYQATAHDGAINSLMFTSDGLFLLTFGTDNKLKLWSTLTGLKEVVNYGKIINNTKNKQIAVTVDADPKLVYVPSAGSILVYEVHTGLRVNALLGHCSCVNACVYHPHFHELYSGGNDRNVLIWTPDERKQKEHQDNPQPIRIGIGRPGRNITDDAWSSDDEG